MNKKTPTLLWQGIGAGVLLFASHAVLADISGKVFRDFNANGTFDTGAFNEVGMSGVTVKAFAAADTASTPSVTTTSGADGSYALTGLSSGVDYRVEFSWSQPWLKPGAAAGTSVQFVKDGSTTAHFALSTVEDTPTTTPYLAVPHYINGNPTAASVGDQPGLYVLPYDAINADDGSRTPEPTVKATMAQVGATWGVAYQHSSKTLYAAVLRRFVGLGPLGTGGIYKIDMTNPTTPSSGSLNYLDVQSLGIPTGTDPREATGCNSIANNINEPAHDIAAANQVGVSGIGGLTMDNDYERLWLVNLADRKLYGIQNISPTTTPTATDVLGGYAISLPAGYACQSGEARPWAVKYHQGNVYVGVLCDASATYPGTSELQGFVLRFDPVNAGAGFAVEHSFGFANPRAGYGTDVYPWYAWNEYLNSAPLLTSIEFDVDGSLVVGIMDKLTMRAGNNNYNSLSCTDETLSDVTGGGDTLRFCQSNSGYIEGGTAGCATTIPDAVKTHAEYYWGDYGPLKDSNIAFNETTFGGLAFLPGTGQVVSNGFDPTGFHQNGLYWLDNQTGADAKRYSIYTSPTGNSFPAATMGKTAGLGDVEMVVDATPIEVGNRVWLDMDSDGIQDAGEAGIDGVNVVLTCGTDTATLKTANGGQFLFSNKTNATFMGAGESCKVTIASAGQTPLAGLSVTTQNADSITDNNAATDLRDSDATTGGEVAFTVGNAGENNHTLDIGYKSAPAVVVDLGDAPDTYNTTLAKNGARHTIVAGLNLGAVVDAEADGQSNAAADGDGVDEDGVHFLTKLVPGENALMGVGTTQPKNSDAKLDAWIDFNGDGDFDDSGEQVAVSQNIKASTLINQGSLPLDVSVPADAKAGKTYARFRLSTAGGLLPTGEAVDGEVEDYAVDIVQGAILGDYVWQDINKDGIQDSGEPAVAGVLVNLIRVSDSAVVKSTFTDATGAYFFTHLSPDAYQVEFVAPTGYTFTTALQGSDDTKDSNADATTGRTASITLAEGDNQRQWDAGLVMADNTIVHCDAVPFKSTELSETLSLPKFDGALGTLTEVKVSAYSATRQFIASENSAAQTQKVKFVSNVDGTLSLPDTTVLNTATSYNSGFKNLTVADGIMDYRGTAAFALSDWLYTTNSQTAVYATPADFTTATAGEKISLPYETLSGLSTTGGGGNVQAVQRTTAAVGACVAYTYAKKATAVDLKLTKVADKTTAKHGDTVVYTLTVTNESTTTDATGVKLMDTLPAGVTYGSDDGLGSYNKTTGEWIVGSLPKGDSKVLKITVTLN